MEDGVVCESEVASEEVDEDLGSFGHRLHRTMCRVLARPGKVTLMPDSVTVRQLPIIGTACFRTARNHTWPGGTEADPLTDGNNLDDDNVRGH